MFKQRTINQLKRPVSQRVFSFVVAAACLISALPSMLLLTKQTANAAVNRSNVKVDATTLVHEPLEYKDHSTKKIDIMRAQNTTGNWDWVYCVRAGTLAPENASVSPDDDKLKDPTVSAKACELMGRLMQVQQYGTDANLASWGFPNLEAGDYYIMRQLAVWNFVYMYLDGDAQNTMRTQLTQAGVDPDSIFKGIDLNKFRDDDAYQYAFLVKGAHTIYAHVTSDLELPQYTGNPMVFQAKIVNKTSLGYDTNKKAYTASFGVNVVETHTNKVGGKFKFQQIQGCTVYYNDAGGTKHTANTSTEFSSGQAFWIETTYENMTTVNSKKQLKLSAVATSGAGNEAVVYEYGLFADPNNSQHQTFFSNTVTNKSKFEPDDMTLAAQEGSFSLTKVTEEGDREQGAKFQFYSSNYATYAAAKAAGLGWEGTTNANGRLAFANVQFGEYTLVQTEATDKTWLMSPNPMTGIVINSTDEVRFGQIVNTMKKGYFQIYKKAATSDEISAGIPFDDLTNEAGAKFVIYDSSFGGYQFAPSDRKATLTTNAQGVSNVVELPIGKYTVEQTDGPDDTLFIDPFEVTITANDSPDNKTPYISKLTNKYYELNIQIQKTDSVSGKIIPAAGVEFSVYTSDKKTVIADKNGNTVFKTNAQGKANITSLNLHVGTYYLKELKAPDGFVINPDFIQFKAEKGQGLIKVGDISLLPIAVSNKPVSITLSLSKDGDLLSGTTSIDTGYNNLKGVDFTYSKLPLAGAKFDLYCDSDVKAPDGSYRTVTINGTSVQLKKGNKLGTFTTNESGSIRVNGLYLDATSATADYYFVESSVPAGFILDKTPVRYHVTDTRTADDIETITVRHSMTNARQKATITLEKVGDLGEIEIPLAGAVFGLYAHEDIKGYSLDKNNNLVQNTIVTKGTLIQIIKSDANGQGKTTVDLPLGYKYDLKELEAPKGFTKSDEVQVIDAKAGNNTSPSFTFKSDKFVNDVIWTNITLNLTKNGEQLSGATVTDTGYKGMTGYDFTYTQQTLPGATFAFYCDSDIMTPDIPISMYDAAKYPDAVKSADGKTFRLYRTFNGKPMKKGTLIGSYKTDANGKITIKNLPCDYNSGKATFYALETKAPDGFLLNSNKVVFNCVRNSVTQTTITQNGSTTNNRQLAVAAVSKVKRVTKYNPVTGTDEYVDVPLGNVVFGLYAASDITNKAGKVVVTKDSLIEIIKTDSNGQGASASALPLGFNYYLKELEAPEGYIMSDETYPVATNPTAGDNTTPVYRFRPSEPVVNTQVETKVELNVTKTGDMLTGVVDKDTDYNSLVGKDFTYGQLPLSGAKFEFFCDNDVLEEALPIAQYDPDLFPYVVKSADGKTFQPYAMFDKDGDGIEETPLMAGTSLGVYTADADGKIVVNGLKIDYDTDKAQYSAVEVSAPAGYVLSTDKVVFNVTRDSKNVANVSATQSAENKKQGAVLIYTKVGREVVTDANGNESNYDYPLEGAIFGLYANEDIYGYEVVNGTLTQVKLLDKDTLIEVITSDADGKIKSTADLPMGFEFYVKELAAPAGYKMSEDKYILKTEANGNLEKIELVSDEVIPNKPIEVRVALNLSKTGDMLTGITDTDTGYEDLKGIDFVYSQLPLAGAEFELYCDSDVKDIAGNFKLFNGIEMKKGALLGTFKTDANGKLMVEGLKLDHESKKATYKAVEISAPAGYLVNKNPVIFECSDTRTNPEETLVSFDGSLENNVQTAKVIFKKVARYDVNGTDFDKPLEGAVIGIYAAEDIYGYKIENGTLTKVLLAKKDTLIEVGVTDKDGKVSSTAKLPSGYTYYAKELEAPQGFVLSEKTVSVKTTVNANASARVASYEAEEAIPDKPFSVSISLNLSKTGEMLTGSEEYDTEYEDMKATRFTFSNLPLAGAEFDLYCNQDIKDVDGSFKKWNDIVLEEGAYLGRFTTNENGKIEVEGLQVDYETESALYSMIERKAPEGFILDESPIIFEVSKAVPKKDQDIIAKDNIASNLRQNAILSFTKVGRDYVFDPETGKYEPVDRPLSEAVFGVYTKEDVLGYKIVDGKLTQVKIVDKDTLIEIVVTDSEGKGKTASALPLNGKFYIKELKAPEGYVLDPNAYDFDTAPKSNDGETPEFEFVLEGDIVNELSRAHIRINKIADDTKLPLQNVEFEVYTKDMVYIETIVTDAEGHAITKTVFPYGETIILHETKTGKNYQLGPDEEVIISVPQEDLDEYGIVDVTIFNYLKSEISIVKLTADGKETPMDGVTFELWQKIEGQPDKLIASEQTDANGKLSFFVDKGNYYLKETNVGKWTRFSVLPLPIEVVTGNIGKVYHYNLYDGPTTVKGEKLSATNGSLLGQCGLSVRKAGDIQPINFKWDEEQQAYVSCGYGYITMATGGLTTVLYTGNDKNSDQFGKITILGLDAGEYEVYEVEAPKGYRNDSQLLKVTVKTDGTVEVLRFYDSMKTGETNQILGYGLMAGCGVLSITFASLAAVYYIDYFRRKKEESK